MELLYLLPAAGLCLLGGLVLLLRFSRRGGLHPVVRELLNQAMGQRSIMLVEFVGRDAADGRFFGPCVEFDEHTVLIDLSLHQEPQGWTNGAVSVNFDINHKGINSYYQYMSQVRGLPRLAGGFGMLLDTPTEIVSNQKRSFVRVAPPKEVTFGIGIWSLDPAQERPGDPAVLGVAQLSYRLDHPEQMSLLNVSAAGLHLELRSPQDEQPPVEPRPGDRLLCLLMLRSQEGGRTLPFWLDCTVVHRGEKKHGPHIAVGLHFNAWAAPQQGKAVDWFTVGENGAVGPLAAWVLQQQLAQVAQKNH